ncbi:MAG: hypothetical protein ABH859_08375 [Pseudomonadota bacterium]
MNKHLNKFLLILSMVCCLLSMVSCSGDQFSSWRVENFEVTPITMQDQKIIFIQNPDQEKEQHIRGIGFDKGSNAVGHFQINAVELSGQNVGLQDIVVPPGGSLAIIAVYEPQNMETTFANYGGWETGHPERWIPGSPEEVEERMQEQQQAEREAIHRSILQATYDYPKEGVIQIELVGFARPGPHGETVAGGIPGECNPGGGIACYSGGFAIDIPQLYAGGPRELELAGDVKFRLNGSEISIEMEDFPVALMVLRSEEIPELPSGVTATLIISGSEDVIATGTFDGSRINLEGVSFRVRFVLGELLPEDITAGVAAMADFDIPNLKVTTTEPYSQGSITMHLETTLSDSPTGDALFDQFLSNANVIVVMKGQLQF